MIAHGSISEVDNTDEVLVERVRAGDDSAFADLYRRHSQLAVAVARNILRSPQDAEDAAAEAFTNVLSALRRQIGPREMFRPYLLACVRNTCCQRLRQRSRQACSRDRSVDDADTGADERLVESAVAAAAFQSMPARWQSALWMAEVQNLDPATIAERLGLNAAAASALVYRARQGFAEAYLRQHLRNAGGPACASLAPKLAQYVRGTAGTMTSRQIQSHISECSNCASAISELADVNSSLRSLPVPVSLLTAGATVGAISGSAATTSVAGLGLGWLIKGAIAAVLSATVLAVSGDAPPPAMAAPETSPELQSNTDSQVGVVTTSRIGSRASTASRVSESTADLYTAQPDHTTVAQAPIIRGRAHADADPSVVSTESAISLDVPSVPAEPVPRLPVVIPAPDSLVVQTKEALEVVIPLVTLPPIALPSLASIVQTITTAPSDLTVVTIPSAVSLPVPDIAAVPVSPLTIPTLPTLRLGGR